MILDADAPNNEILTEQQHELVESAAEMLYGLIHVRYILTSRGMSTMFEKYKQCEFGRCPRVLCNDQPALPVGLADTPRQNTVKIYCPRCGDIYSPRYKYQVRACDLLGRVCLLPASMVSSQRVRLCSMQQHYLTNLLSCVSGHELQQPQQLQRHAPAGTKSSLLCEPGCMHDARHPHTQSLGETLHHAAAISAAASHAFPELSVIIRLQTLALCQQSNVDGSYFGTTFPHLLLMTYPALRPPKVQEAYVPRVFGFRLHQGKREASQAADTTSSEPMQHSVQARTELPHQHNRNA